MRGAAGRVGPRLVVGRRLVRRPREQVDQVPSYERKDLGDRDVAPELGTQRGDPRVGDPARDEAGVPRQVDVAVEGEAVHGDALADPDAERGDLALRPPLVGAQPDAAPAGHARGLDAEVAADPDQRLLDATDVVDDLDVVGEPDDGVADELAGAVEGDQAAAVDVDHRRAAGVGGAVAGRRALAGGEDRRVLEQPDGVGRPGRPRPARGSRAGCPRRRGSRRPRRRTRPRGRPGRSPGRAYPRASACSDEGELGGQHPGPVRRVVVAGPEACW